MQPSRTRTSRLFEPTAAWAVLVALAAVAALLAARFAPPGGLTGGGRTALRLSPVSQTSAATGRSAGGMSAASGGASGSSSHRTIAVSIHQYAFSPASLTINVGDTVTWTNMDSAAHTVTSSSGPEKLSSPQLKKGQSWSFTFTKAGTYAYYCAVHPDMKGSITVGGKSAGGSGGTTCEPSLVSSVTDPFWMHFKAAHLDRGPAEQVSDLMNTDQYVKTHTALVQRMTGPAEEEVSSHATDGPDAFWMHFQHAHLQESPGQQSADLMNTDRYVKTHTVLVENMLDPYVGIVTGTC